MIVLDTHIFLWMNLEPERLTGKHIDAIQTEDKLGLSAISLWEMAMLAHFNRIDLPPDLERWITNALANEKIHLIPISPSIAALSGGLNMHGDPADRLIAASAIAYDCPLATSDKRILRLSFLRTIH